PPSSNPSFTAPLVTSGTLSAHDVEQFRGVRLPEAGVLHVEFSTPTIPGVATAVEVALINSQGKVVFQQAVSTGQTLNANIFLGAGNYSWRIVGGTADGSALPTISWQMRSELLNDPIGPQLVIPLGGQAPQRDITPYWRDVAYYWLWKYITPFGRPIDP